MEEGEERGREGEERGREGKRNLDPMVISKIWRLWLD